MVNCEECGAVEKLQIHHTSYEPPETIVVCSTCHGKKHPNHGVGCVDGSPRPICQECKIPLRRFYMKAGNGSKMGVAWGCRACKIIKWDDGKKEEK